MGCGGAKYAPAQTQQGANMFDLKKYQVKKSFAGYKPGALVAFNGADAERFKDFIVCVEKEVKAEVKEEKKVKTVKRGKK